MRIIFPKATAFFVLIFSWLVFSTAPANSQPRLTQEIIDNWTDSFFYIVNDQLSRRKIRSNETQYIREWNAIQRVVTNILVYQKNICMGSLSWTLRNYEDDFLSDGDLLVSEDLDKVADAIFYARHPELGYRKVQAGETSLANEWMQIRREVNMLHPCFTYYLEY